MTLSISDSDEDIDWNTDDELEIQNYTPCGEGSSSKSNVVKEFVSMEFPEEFVIEAVKANGEDDVGAILDTLLTLSAIHSTPQELPSTSTDPYPSTIENAFQQELSDEENSVGDMEDEVPLTAEDKMLADLLDMGYPADVVFTAMKRCGEGTPMEVLVDFISAAHIAKEADALLSDNSSENVVTSSVHVRNGNCRKGVKRKSSTDERQERTWKRLEKRKDEGSDRYHLPNPMIGFGIPGGPTAIIHRRIPNDAKGPPYFYYENVALTPKGSWEQISRFLCDIEPEFVDSLHFSASARKRGYVHNLPIENRFNLQPIPPLTVQEAFPATRKWWPSWDKRTKLNCLQTCIASAPNLERIRKALEPWDGTEPPPKVQKYVLGECKRWNLIWVGKNKAAPLDPAEIEELLGFPRDHTRGISKTERHRVLGNSFQVDTVGYHLSVLKGLFPEGMNVLSLFSGIGGAEVSLHRLGIPLKNVVAVEISKPSRYVLRSWWEDTRQPGNLIEVEDVQEVTPEHIEQWVNTFGGFDLVIGGSPCNNLSGSNRYTRHGLEGHHSQLFFEYFRILDLVKSLMRK